MFVVVVVNRKKERKKSVNCPSVASAFIHQVDKNNGCENETP